MSRPGITYQEIVNAANQLIGECKNPTVDRVREILGTGSKTTIARYLKEWKGNANHDSNWENVPQELIALVNGLWQRLKEEADLKIQAFEEDAAIKLEEWEQKYTEEQKIRLTITNQNHELKENLSHITQQNAELDTQRQDEKQLNATLTERNELLSEQLSDQKAEVNRLHQLLSHVQANMEHYQLSMQKLREEQIIAMEKQKIAHETQIRQMKSELEETNLNKRHIERESDQLKTELITLKDLYQKNESERTNQIKQLKENHQQITVLDSNNNQLEKELKLNRSQLEKSTATIRLLEKNEAVLKNEQQHTLRTLNETKDQLYFLRDEKFQLIQEKAHLEGQFKQLEQSLKSTV